MSPSVSVSDTRRQAMHHTIEEQRLDIDRMHIRWAMPDFLPRCAHPGCTELLNDWALKHGFSYCSRQCREADRAR